MGSSPAEPIVRAARVGDATAMGEVHVAAWQVGYRGILPDELLDGLTVERSAANWTASLGGGGGGAETAIVAELNGRLAGICSFGPYRLVEGETPPADRCELWMLNVHPDAWGTGVAQALLAAAVDGLRADRPEPVAALWVLEGNGRGRRFYEKEGWRSDGGIKRETLGGHEVVELRYCRAL